MAKLHIVPLYAGILGLFLVVLSFNMLRVWMQQKDAEGNRELLRAEALVSSFGEYVPLALLLLLCAEIAGVPSWASHMLGAALVAARVMHAFGSNAARGSALLRFAGAQLTYLVISLASFSCLFFYAVPGAANLK
ncbi:MAG: MAPEG family protein [Alphaproteobacteria bacterium]|nr:MAPEG family protein [Alphaproteobacteria bacterium]